MNYLVATSPDGDSLWWCEWEAIPNDHTNVRPATPEEAAVMDKIARAKNPSIALGHTIQRMLRRNQNVLL